MPASTSSSAKTLCLDFGNTRLKAAIFENNELTQELTLADDQDATVEDLLAVFLAGKNKFHNGGGQTGNNRGRSPRTFSGSRSLFSEQEQPYCKPRQLHYLQFHQP